MGRAPESRAEEEALELRLSSIGTLPSLPRRYCRLALKIGIGECRDCPRISDEGFPSLLVMPLELAQVLDDYPELHAAR